MSAFYSDGKFGNFDCKFGNVVEALGKALECIIELRRQLGAERRYIEALEGQLEPSVIEEIKAELEAQAQEEASQIERK